MLTEPTLDPSDYVRHTVPPASEMIVGSGPVADPFSSDYPHQVPARARFERSFDEHHTEAGARASATKTIGTLLRISPRRPTTGAAPADERRKRRPRRGGAQLLVQRCTGSGWPPKPGVSQGVALQASRTVRPLAALLAAVPRASAAAVWHALRTAQRRTCTSTRTRRSPALAVSLRPGVEVSSVAIWAGRRDLRVLRLAPCFHGLERAKAVAGMIQGPSWVPPACLAGRRPHQSRTRLHRYSLTRPTARLA